MQKKRIKYYYEFMDCIDVNDTADENYKKLTMLLSEYKHPKKVIELALCQFKGIAESIDMSGYMGIFYAMLILGITIIVEAVFNFLPKEYPEIELIFSLAVFAIIFYGIFKLKNLIQKTAEIKYKQGFIIYFLESKKEQDEKEH